MPSPPLHAANGPFAGLELLSSAVVLVDGKLFIRYINPGAENLFAISQRKLIGQPLARMLGAPPGLSAALDNALRTNWSYTGQDLTITRNGSEPIRLDCTVTPVETSGVRLLLEFRPIDAQLRVAREEQLLHQQQANRELIRNLAHEIKNPLGGIRGSAQLLQHELDDPQLREFTDVIIAEADRLQDLMNRLLSSHSMMRPAPLNIHDVLERVRRLILAEFPQLSIRRDYDLSLPELTADREQLIQATLNIVRNAAQALEGHGEILLRTRIARQVTLAKRRFKLALELQVIDNGPGIPAEIRDKIFYPLVSGRDGGSGLGLSLAQSFIEQHQGMIDVDSRPGRTCFSILLPISERT
ncbi:nitrogen regulation protein NR(II) [Thauera mechernichensis]|uniref:Sensory histidine kinase/phosphatase NtrB n=1 Tax=Thauera mechernichensis TaxID=82788 RepID=A0ABW3WFX5_9RHOO|nr:MULTISPECIES: nitrogen regulation protein NR(II) [Thauera]ENO81450.1 nitrogen specific signal transduction histidine kinase NtrB [Thauera sp. 27]ENO91749.1 nitrogen specific signal transduction histidine kinase NtrB [Thauera sp. 28]MDG3066360.1 nitrogen regulation protein NR(II) [Thauera mechernichensis]WBL64929.1 nitrogen regulation protein NR(II) [Thauera sp. WB-2]HAG74116.1 nitrogen regulation protein NR(II) [Thauera sp.]